MHFNVPIGVDVFNPEQNMAVGSKMLARLLRKYGSEDKALAAYNAGEGRVDRLISKHGDNYQRFLPKETRDYIPKVLALKRMYSGMYSEEALSRNPLLPSGNRDKEIEERASSIAPFLNGGIMANSAPDGPTVLMRDQLAILTSIDNKLGGLYPKAPKVGN